MLCELLKKCHWVQCVQYHCIYREEIFMTVVEFPIQTYHYFGKWKAPRSFGQEIGKRMEDKAANGRTIRCALSYYQHSLSV
jgi:hypothetical protein